MDFSEVLKRRTIRQFTQEPLKKEDLCAILNAARLASCASNKQRLRYLVATESSLVAKILPGIRRAGAAASRSGSRQDFSDCIHCRGLQLRAGAAAPCGCGSGNPEHGVCRMGARDRLLLDRVS